MRGDNILAGGYFLNNILNDYYDLFRNSKGLINNAKSEAKKRILKILLDCDNSEYCWRKYVKNSLIISDAMMNKLYEELVYGHHLYDAVISLSLVLESPGLVGSASGLLSDIFEVGLTIDWLLGLPYYPGSSIKGSVRSMAEELLDEKIVSKIFGDHGERSTRSSIVFYDSYPIGCENKGRYPCLLLSGGVITPHYYSDGKTVKAESDATPTPIQHIIIAPGTVFRIIAGLNCPIYKGTEGSSPEIDINSVKKFVSKILGEDSIKNCVVNVKGKCSCIHEYATAMAALITASLSRGFAARSSKGYNIFNLYEGIVNKNVLSLAIYIRSTASDRKKSHEISSRNKRTTYTGGSRLRHNKTSRYRGSRRFFSEDWRG